MNYLVPVVLIGVLIVITLLLILAERLLGGGKEKMLIVNDDKIIPVKGDDTVLNTLSQKKIFIPSACGGKATCGFCKFHLIDGGEPKPTELPFLSAEDQKNGIRLACQVKVKDNMRVEIPKELMNAKEYKTKVVYIENQTYDIKLVRFQLIDPPTMLFKPGQYAQIKVPGIDIIRAYSIASHPKDTSQIELIIRQVPNGQATTFVHKALEVGDKIILTGPYGDFYLQEESDREMICIAGGSGKAPIRAILYFLRDQGMPRKVKYFFGAKSKRDLYMTDEFLELEKEFPNFKYIPALSEPLPEDNWEGEVGLITDVVDRHVDDLSEAEAYLCGSPGMINACIKVLTKHEIKQQNVFYDKFS